MITTQRCIIFERLFYLLIYDTLIYRIFTIQNCHRYSTISNHFNNNNVTRTPISSSILHPNLLQYHLISTMKSKNNLIQRWTLIFFLMILSIILQYYLIVYIMPDRKNDKMRDDFILSQL